jgi:hypothetical protein
MVDGANGRLIRPGWHVVIATIIVMTLILLPLLANAHPAIAANCLTAPYGRVESGARDNSTWITANGVRASVWFNAPVNYDCSRVSSLTVAKASTGAFAEWGWSLGYSCMGVWHDRPSLFLAWFTPTIPYNCRSDGEQNGDQFRNLTVQDASGDGVWSAFLGLGSPNIDSTPNLGFIRGLPLDMGERHSSTESAWSHFQNLKYLPLSSSSYADWDHLQNYCDDDPSYDLDKVSATENYVDLDGIPGAHSCS